MEELSAYKIHWLTLVPIRGKVTKKDAKVTGFICAIGEMSQHFSSKERALAIAESFRGLLTKPYRAYIYTDKQWGSRTPGARVDFVLTGRQRADSFVI